MALQYTINSNMTGKINFEETYELLMKSKNLKEYKRLTYIRNMIIGTYDYLEEDLPKNKYKFMFNWIDNHYDEYDEECYGHMDFVIAEADQEYYYQCGYETEIFPELQCIFLLLQK